jgi:hypothetical protein
MDFDRKLRRCRAVLAVFVAGLIASGLTAFPLLHELSLLCGWLGISPGADPAGYAGVRLWIAIVRQGLDRTYALYPWVAYGTDWLAFAHLAIAVFFIGPLVDPVKNKWVLQAGIVACAGVIPLALLAGAARGIPMYWRLVDCSFGVLGAAPLWYGLRLAEELEAGGTGRGTFSTPAPYT